MGGGISTNFDEIQLKFETKFWKVHTALKKDDNTQVYLWLLKQQSIDDTIKNRKDREKFKMLFVQAIAQARKIHHPNVLKIYDISEDLNNFGFSSEPIDNILINDKELTEDEILYVSDQIIKVIHFLHTQAKLLYLGLSPEAVCISKTLEVKIFNFNFSIPFTELPVIPQQFDLVSQLPITYTPPEYLMNQLLSYSADVYSIGCFIATLYKGSPFITQRSVEELVADFSVDKVTYPENMSSEMKDLVSKCLNLNQNRRPTLEDIIKSPAFTQITIRALRYVDLFVVKSNKEKYDFYKGLFHSIGLFSLRIQRLKFLPLMINDVLSEPNFATAVIPNIFKIGQSMDDKDFINVIVNPLKNILKLTFPLELGIINLNCMDIILEKTNDASLVLPVFIDSIKNDNVSLRNEAVKHIAKIVRILDQGIILNTLIPILIDFTTNSSNSKFLCSIIECFSACCDHVNNNKFAFLVIPQLTMCYNRVHDAEVADNITKIAKKLKTSSKITMKYTVPMLSDILSNINVNVETQESIMEIIEKAVNDLIIDRNLEAKAAVWRPDIDYKPQKPIKEPLIPAKIDVNYAKSLYRDTNVRSTLTSENKIQDQHENAKAKLFFSKPRQTSTLPTQVKPLNQMPIQQPQQTNIPNQQRVPIKMNRNQQNTYNATTPIHNKPNIPTTTNHINASGNINLSHAPVHTNPVTPSSSIIAPPQQSAPKPVQTRPILSQSKPMQPKPPQQTQQRPSQQMQQRPLQQAQPKPVQSRPQPQPMQPKPVQQEQPQPKPPVADMFSGMKLASPRRTK
ncbi:protein kinase [Histomonas meleagridis]|uniref:protein kinase n=1 Tax=Histomonas meleagridis TaxID=135588 RepID=UPI00355A8B66|nr:protein kinase [Histomonas meleagridis]KAH0799561.1 protein kinase [Histomonas meleagridis]